MRIAILANSFDEQAGGAGRIAAVYIDALRQRGHEVHTWGPKDWFARRGKMGPFHRLMEHVRDMAAWEKTAQDIIQWKPDVLWTHNLTGCGFGTPRMVQAAHIPWVHMLHDVQLVEPSGQIRREEAFPVLRRVWRTSWSWSRQRVFGKPDGLLSPTKWLSDFHQSWGWFRGMEPQVIPNPISVAKKDGIHQKGEVLYVGRLEQDKGFGLLLEAWGRVTCPGKKLVCIGDGTGRRRVEQGHDPTIEIRGWKTSDEVLAAMSHAAIVVVPSQILENQPTVILEGVLSGCHVLAADDGGIPETMQGVGHLFPAGDVDALKEKIEYLASLPLPTVVPEAWANLHRVEVAVGSAEAVFKSKR